MCVDCWLRLLQSFFTRPREEKINEKEKGEEEEGKKKKCRKLKTRRNEKLILCKNVNKILVNMHKLCMNQKKKKKATGD